MQSASDLSLEIRQQGDVLVIDCLEFKHLSKLAHQFPTVDQKPLGSAVILNLAAMQRLRGSALENLIQLKDLAEDYSIAIGLIGLDSFNREILSVLGLTDQVPADLGQDEAEAINQIQSQIPASDDAVGTSDSDQDDAADADFEFDTVGEIKGAETVKFSREEILNQADDQSLGAVTQNRKSTGPYYLAVDFSDFKSPLAEAPVEEDTFEIDLGGEMTFADTDKFTPSDIAQANAPAPLPDQSRRQTEVLPAFSGLTDSELDFPAATHENSLLGAEAAPAAFLAVDFSDFRPPSAVADKDTPPDGIETPELEFEEFDLEPQAQEPLQKPDTASKLPFPMASTSEDNYSPLGNMEQPPFENPFKNKAFNPLAAAPPVAPPPKPAPLPANSMQDPGATFANQKTQKLQVPFNLLETKAMKAEDRPQAPIPDASAQEAAVAGATSTQTAPETKPTTSTDPADPADPSDPADPADPSNADTQPLPRVTSMFMGDGESSMMFQGGADFQAQLQKELDAAAAKLAETKQADEDAAKEAAAKAAEEAAAAAKAKEEEDAAKAAEAKAAEADAAKQAQATEEPSLVTEIAPGASIFGGDDDNAMIIGGADFQAQLAAALAKAGPAPQTSPSPTASINDPQGSDEEPLSDSQRLLLEERKELEEKRRQFEEERKRLEAERQALEQAREAKKAKASGQSLEDSLAAAREENRQLALNAQATKAPSAEDERKQLEEKLREDRRRLQEELQNQLKGAQGKAKGKENREELRKKLEDELRANAEAERLRLQEEVRMAREAAAAKSSSQPTGKFKAWTGELFNKIDSKDEDEAKQDPEKKLEQAPTQKLAPENITENVTENVTENIAENITDSPTQKLAPKKLDEAAVSDDSERSQRRRRRRGPRRRSTQEVLQTEQETLKRAAENMRQEQLKKNQKRFREFFDECSIDSLIQLQILATIRQNSRRVTIFDDIADNLENVKDSRVERLLDELEDEEVIRSTRTPQTNDEIGYKLMLSPAEYGTLTLALKLSKNAQEWPLLD